VSFQLKVLISSTLFCLVSSCARNTTPAVPNAPPPYPDYPVPQSHFQYSEPPYQPNPPLLDSGNIQLDSQASSSQLPYASQDIVIPTYHQENLDHAGYPYEQVKQTARTRFSLHAHSNLWALVQNDKGVELEWLKMKAGEKASINHSGRLTITCSSGKDLEIFDARGDKIPTNPNPSGISIIRL